MGSETSDNHSTPSFPQRCNALPSSTSGSIKTPASFKKRSSPHLQGTLSSLTSLRHKHPQKGSNEGGECRWFAQLPCLKKCRSAKQPDDLGRDNILYQLDQGGRDCCRGSVLSSKLLFSTFKVKSVWFGISKTKKIETFMYSNSPMWFNCMPPPSTGML